ncbi:MAG: nucleoside kinase, partial [Prevotella sp.]|nr:nucleoside kinase [Prevotella sp.]
MEYGPICARVNNKVEGMHFQVFRDKDVEFLDLTNASAQRAYTRSLFFVLNKAAHDLWPNCTVVIDIPVSNGYYVDIRRVKGKGRNANDDVITPDDAHDLRTRMQELIDAALPIHRHETTTEEAIKMFE